MIDQCVLSPLATAEDVRQGCHVVKKLKLHGICVNSYYAELAADLLDGTAHAVVVTIAFPLGSTSTSMKVREAEFAAEAGATELDMVPRLGLLRESSLIRFWEDIHAVVQAQNIPARVALEMSMLADTYERALAAILSEAAGAAAVKTSTGFPYDLSREYGLGSAEERERDVQILAASVSPSVGIKVAGGIRTHSHAMRLIRSGASRIGTSDAARVLARSAAAVPPAVAT